MEIFIFCLFVSAKLAFDVEFDKERVIFGNGTADALFAVLFKFIIPCLLVSGKLDEFDVEFVNEAVIFVNNFEALFCKLLVRFVTAGMIFGVTAFVGCVLFTTV